MFYNKKRLNNKKKLNQKEQTEEDAKIKYNQSIQNSFNLIILKYFQILEAFEDNVKIYNDYLEAKTINQDPNPILKYIKYCKLFSIISNKGSFKLANIHVSNTTSGELKKFIYGDHIVSNKHCHLERLFDFKFRICIVV